MSRLSVPSRDGLDAAGQEIWDRISGPRKGMHGPYLMLMHVPALADQVAQLGGFLRFYGSLPGTVRELAVLCTARTLNVPFEFYMHRPVAEREGIPADTIEAVRANHFELLKGRDRLVANAAVAICRDRQLSDELFQQAVGDLGAKLVVELVTLIAFYNTIADIINCFKVDLPEGAANPFD